MARTDRAPDEDVRRRPGDDANGPVRRARPRDDEDDADDEPFVPRKKRKSAARPVKLILRIVTGVVLAILLIVLLYWVYSPVGIDYSMLCYLPKETTRVSGYDVEEVAKNGKMKAVHEMILNNYRQFGDRRFPQATGVATTDVLKYLHGVASGNPDEEKDLRPQDRRGAVTVVRFRNAVDTNRFISSYGNGPYRVRERQSRDGKTFHQLYRMVPVPPDGHLEEEDDISFFFPNSRTLVYATTRRECEEALTRQPGRVVLEGNMRELADKVDGHYFNATVGWYEFNGFSDTMAFGLGVVNEDVRDQKNFTGRIGSGSWFASNGNDFLFASASMYSDSRTARDVKRKLKASVEKAQAEIWQGEAGIPSGLEDPFNPKQKAQPGGAGGFGGGFGGGTDNETTKDILLALSEYIRYARVYNRGRLVIFEGMIPHGTEEQGIFEKFWKAVAGKFGVNQFGGPGGFGPPGMMGPPGMGPQGGMPMPGRPPGG